MTPIGRRVLILYSIIVLAYISFKSIQKLAKGGGKGWTAAMLLPTLILLLNLT